jgi:YidC/Oxa1 family membrane protein insertase
MMYGFPALTLLFTWWLPAALQLSFFISGLLSFAQASLFRNNSFRRYFNMTPQPSPDTPSSPYKGTMRIASSVPSPAPSSGMPRSSPVLSTSELNSRFQASSSGSEARQSSVSKTQGLLKKLTKPISEVADSGRAMVAKGNKSMDARREKSEMEERRRYEAKRQEELKKERWERENERRAERAARKSRNV